MARPTFRGYVQVTFDNEGHRVELFLRRVKRPAYGSTFEPEFYEKDETFIVTTFDAFADAVDEAFYVAERERGLKGRMKELIYENGIRVFFT